MKIFRDSYQMTKLKQIYIWPGFYVFHLAPWLLSCIHHNDCGRVERKRRNSLPTDFSIMQSSAHANLKGARGSYREREKADAAYWHDNFPLKEKNNVNRNFIHESVARKTVSCNIIVLEYAPRLSHSILIYSIPALIYRACVTSLTEADPKQ